MAIKNPETAVREYLMALKNPEALRDETSIAATREKLETSTDPVERLHLRGDLALLSQVNADVYEEGFIAHAKAWADEEGIDAEAFAAEGVDADVLKRAGFKVAAKRQGKRTARKPASGARIGQDQVKAAIKAMKVGTSTTVKRLAEEAGAGVATASKALATAEIQGLVKKSGTDFTHEGPGRAPTHYERVK